MHLVLSSEQFLLNGGELKWRSSSSARAIPQGCKHYDHRLIHNGNNGELKLLKSF